MKTKQESVLSEYSLKVPINTFITLPVGAEKGDKNGFTVRVGRTQTLTSVLVSHTWRCLLLITVMITCGFV